MKTIILSSISLLIAASAYAQSAPLLETTSDARARHSAQRYETYKNNNYQAPLGGYQDKLGDPAPRGTISPGYATSPRSSHYGSGGNRYNGSSNY